MASNRTYFVILGGAALWCIAIVGAPLCVAEGGLFGFPGVLLYKFFHPICHQLDNRSFQILGRPLAVCIRCTAIYTGFSLGVLVYPLAGPWIRGKASLPIVLLWSVVPMLIDVTMDVIGLHASTPLTRCLTGSTFGIVVAFTIVPAAQEGVREFLTGSHLFSPTDARKGSLHA